MSQSDNLDPTHADLSRDRQGATRTHVRPAEFSLMALRAIEASEGRRKRRHRNTEPDKIGLDIKRDLLRQAGEEDPDPDDFEAWLLGKALSAPASGPVRALGGEILDEYHLARYDPDFSRWLTEGARSDDADPDSGGTFPAPERWR